METSNPLGSYRGKHKLGKQLNLALSRSMILRVLYTKGLFYFVIGNIDPKIRSTLRCIQLIACVKTTLLDEYGFGNVLKPFIDDVNRLSKVICDHSDSA